MEISEPELDIYDRSQLDLTAESDGDLFSHSYEGSLLSSDGQINSKPGTNLKICIDNEQSEGVEQNPEVLFVKMEVEDLEEGELEEHSQSDIRVNFDLALNRSSILDKSKVYENKAGPFVTGIDLRSPEVKAKRKARAQRFGLTVDPADEKKLDTSELFRSLGLSEEDFGYTNPRGIRINAIMLRGVDNLNTEEIFEYFGKYPPRNLEWIDDSSCNVVFADADTASRALLNISEMIKYPSAKRSTETASNKKVSGHHPEQMPDEDSVGDESLDLNEEPPQRSTLLSGRASLVSERPEGRISDDASNSGIFVDEHDLPPGRWRLGIPHTKAPKLFMRFATKADKKVAGAERRSDFYRKHGNPNYGGMTGLISSSKKKRLRHNEEAQLEIEAHFAVSGGRNAVSYADDGLFGDLNNEPGEPSVADGSHVVSEDAIPPMISADLRSLTSAGLKRHHSASSEASTKERFPSMRMHADEEEEKIRSFISSRVAALDVRSKLGSAKEERLRNWEEEATSKVTPRWKHTKSEQGERLEVQGMRLHSMENIRHKIESTKTLSDRLGDRDRNSMHQVRGDDSEIIDDSYPSRKIFTKTSHSADLRSRLSRENL